MAAIRLNVSQLRCACHGEAWRGRWIAGENPDTMPRDPAAGPAVYGRIFHGLADKFAEWLAEPANAGVAMELKDGDLLWGAMYDRFAWSELLALCTRGQVAEAYELTRRLQRFCRRLSDLRAELPVFHSWRFLFVSLEHAMKDVPYAFGEHTWFLSGRLDALRLHPRGGLVIVDYKLTGGAHLKQDLLQLAIYADMLQKTRPGLRFHGLLEYYEPELRSVEVTPEELDAIFQETVLPNLRMLAPSGFDDAETRPVEPFLAMPAAAGETPPAETPFPVNTAPEEPVRAEGKEPAKEEPKEEPVTAAEPPSEEAAKDEPLVLTKEEVPAEPDPEHETEDHSEAIRRCFASFQMDVSVTDRQDAPQLTRYRLRPASRVKSLSLQSRAEDLQAALGLEQTPLMDPAQGYVTLDIPRAHSEPVQWKTLMESPELKRHASPVCFPAGMGVANGPLIADLQDPNTAHMLVAGASGSGKSEFLKSLVATLIFRNDPATLRLTLVDPKVLTFGALEHCPHLTEPVITEIPAALACLEAALLDMEERYRQLAVEGFENLAQRHAADRGDIPWRVILFDEFADLILAGKAEKTRFEALVSRLAAKGRAAGIHLVLATERPDRNVVTGLIKANLPLRVCLQVPNAVNSQLIIEQNGGESLFGHGDLLCGRGRGVERAQSPFITQEELSGLGA